MNDATTIVSAILDEHLEVARASRAALAPDVAALAAQLIETFGRGGRLLVFGNGGSAADAQHLAGELTGHFARDRRPLPVLALTTDTSVLTATANDYAYAEVFSRQVAAHVRAGDVVLGISTSGRAANVIAGVEVARAAGAQTWALTGASGARLADVAEHAIRVPSDVTARVQEMHVIVIHAVSELVDAWAGGET
jgi:D-sedoheptulose 7-phosphate isomerase